MIGLRVFDKRHAKLVNFENIFEPKYLPGGANLICLSRDHISIRRQIMSIWLLAHD